MRRFATIAAMLIWQCLRSIRIEFTSNEITPISSKFLFELTLITDETGCCVEKLLKRNYFYSNKF